MHKCEMILYDDFLSYPINSLFSSTHGDNMERINDDFEIYKSKYTSLYPDIVVSIATCVSYEIYILYHSIWIGLLLFVIALLQIIPPILIKKFLQVNYDNCRDIEAKLTDIIIEGFDGIKTIKLFELEKWWMKKIINLHKKYCKIASASIYANSVENVLNALIGHMLTFGTYAMVGLFALKDFIPLQLAIQIIALSGSLYSSTNFLFNTIPQFSILKLATSRLRKWPAENIQIQNVIKVEQGNDNFIQLKIADFSYNGTNILNNFRYTFLSDQKYKIIGKNGAGKTTLINIISTLLLCNDGYVKYGTNNIKLKDNSPLPISYLFLVPQHDYSFNITGKEFYEMILPEKVETIKHFCYKFGLSNVEIEFKNINMLSSGERKKIFLSLAFALDPIFLILDEPTNFLDENGRIRLLDLLKERVNSTIIVTHSDEFDDIVDNKIEIVEGKIKNA